MKKLIALVLTASLVLAMATVAFANPQTAGGEGDIEFLPFGGDEGPVDPPTVPPTVPPELLPDDWDELDTWTITFWERNILAVASGDVTFQSWYNAGDTPTGADAAVVPTDWQDMLGLGIVANTSDTWNVVVSASDFTFANGNVAFNTPRLYLDLAGGTVGTSDTATFLDIALLPGTPQSVNAASGTMIGIFGQNYTGRLFIPQQSVAVGTATADITWTWNPGGFTS